MMAQILLSDRGGKIDVTIELPELIGSDKQIAWANDIRLRAIKAKLGKAIECPASAKRFFCQCCQKSPSK
jgi:hypothetical protein